MLVQKRRCGQKLIARLLAAAAAVSVCCGCGQDAADVMGGTGQELETEAESDTGRELEAETELDTRRDLEAEAESDLRTEGADSESAYEGAKGLDGQASENLPAQKRTAPVKVKGIYVSGPVAGIDKMDEMIALVDETELNAIVLDIKNDEGRVTYKMQTETVLEIESGIRYIPDIQELVAKCKEKNIYLIARIVAFRDPYLAQEKPELAVKTKDGGIFTDKNGLAWVNPYKREVWDYLAEIAAQAAAEGFDEIQFDYIRFSTDVDEEKADYGMEATGVGKAQIITECMEYLYDKLSPLGVYVAADVFGTVIDNETDQEIVGQDYTELAKHLDYICPMVYPSHYRGGAYGIQVPDAQPYRTIYEAAASSVKQLHTVPEKDCAKVRVWLQSFTAGWVQGHISYGPEQIRQQIKGAYDAGYEEWILWNAAVNYQRDSLLTDEEAAKERMQWEVQKESAPPISEEDALPVEGATEKDAASSDTVHDATETVK